MNTEFNGIIDTHCHLLPGVDDGSENIEESIEMIKMYKSQGYCGAILTSHYYENKYEACGDTYDIAFAKLENAISENKLDFKIYKGNEIFVDCDAIKLLETGKINTLANSDYVLLELPFLGKARGVEELVYDLKNKGYKPIIAHAERYVYAQEDITYLYDLLTYGALIQINLSSLGKDKNSGVYKTAVKLLESNMVSLVGTDAHSSTWRKPIVDSELNMIKEILGNDIFEEIVYNNPCRIINNEEVNFNIEDVFIDDNYDDSNKSRGKKSIFSLFKKNK